MQFGTTLQNILLDSFGHTDTASSAILILLTLLCIAVPYLLGSVNFALVISKVFYRDDIRKYGSGNAGMTNMLRTYGKGAAAATLLCDMLKSVLSVLFGSFLLGTTFGGYLAGMFCVIGHIFPVFFKFKGGKGVATVAAMILVLDPLCFLLLAIIFVLLVAATRYISLGSIICMMLYPIITYKLATHGSIGFPVLFAFIVAALIIFMHRSNIVRLRNHTENKLSFSKKGSKKKSDTDGKQ